MQYREIEVLPDSVGANIAYVSPMDSTYGLAITLKEKGMELSVVNGIFDSSSPLDIIPSLEWIPPAVLQWYVSACAILDSLPEVSVDSLTEDLISNSGRLRYRDN